MVELINRRKEPDPYRDNNELLCALYQVFSTPEALGNSFIKHSQDRQKKDFSKFHDKTVLSNMTKEKVCTLVIVFNYHAFYIIFSHFILTGERNGN